MSSSLSLARPNSNDLINETRSFVKKRQLTEQNDSHRIQGNLMSIAIRKRSKEKEEKITIECYEIYLFHSNIIVMCI
jgi:hypothetical protein